MRTVKKIKLVLLTSVVMLSVKDVYAMDPDYQEASSSNHPPRLQGLLPDFSPFSPKPLEMLEPSEDGVRRIILNATGLHPSTEIDDQSREELRTILSQISKEDILSRLEGIQQIFLLKAEDISFLKKMGGKPLYAKRGDMDPTLMKGMYSIVAKTLLLSRDEIIARGVAIKKMVDTLFHPPYVKGAAFIPVATNSFDIARSFNLINYAFGLTVDQINERTTTIKEHESHLVPQDDETRPMVIESLFKHELPSLLGRVGLILAYEEEVRSASSSSNRFNAEKAEKTFNQDKVLFSQLNLIDLINVLLTKTDEVTH